MAAAGTPRTTPLVVVAAVGVGLALAPVAFQMFSRAPAGGRMLDDFRPFMRSETLDRFGAHLGLIGSAVAEVGEEAVPAVAEAEGVASTAVWEDLPSTAALDSAWPGIHRDMTAMLDDIAANLERFEAVDALPPFALFPWFFVVPGVLLAGLAALAVRARRHGGRGRRVVAAIVILGLATAAAPVAFQMFSRAPAGAQMIAHLQPLMTEQRVGEVQGYFLVIGAGEGEIRNRLLPRAGQALPAGTSPGERFPQTAALVEQWPGIAADMAPMIGAMADHVDSFAGIAALPPFDLFPWFFVAPGGLVAVLAAAAGRDRGVGQQVGRASQEGVA